ncbi:hypothetical protein CYY_007435 [Polysphondylium violaceum]|uniref:Uncharacterized protein n=1 Tax=Polysphondylium violaceum TaxID=133409 RepID=A0A8J4PP93_9MYCE|nr:hypothetical protein CYY_007435 [Polysphondylium violaceum]
MLLNKTTRSIISLSNSSLSIPFKTYFINLNTHNNRFISSTTNNRYKSNNDDLEFMIKQDEIKKNIKKENKSLLDDHQLDIELSKFINSTTTTTTKQLVDIISKTNQDQFPMIYNYFNRFNDNQFQESIDCILDYCARNAKIQQLWEMYMKRNQFVKEEKDINNSNNNLDIIKKNNYNNSNSLNNYFLDCIIKIQYKYFQNVINNKDIDQIIKNLVRTYISMIKFDDGIQLNLNTYNKLLEIYVNLNDIKMIEETLEEMSLSLIQPSMDTYLLVFGVLNNEKTSKLLLKIKNGGSSFKTGPNMYTILSQELDKFK